GGGGRVGGEGWGGAGGIFWEGWFQVGGLCLLLGAGRRPPLPLSPPDAALLQGALVEPSAQQERLRQHRRLLWSRLELVLVALANGLHGLEVSRVVVYRR